MSRVDRYKCDGCGKEATSDVHGGQPKDWINGWVATEAFHGCTLTCLVRAARAACDKLSMPRPPPPPTDDSPGPRVSKYG